MIDVPTDAELSWRTKKQFIRHLQESTVADLEALALDCAGCGLTDEADWYITIRDLAKIRDEVLADDISLMVGYEKAAIMLWTNLQNARKRAERILKL